MRGDLAMKKYTLKRKADGDEPHFKNTKRESVQMIDQNLKGIESEYENVFMVDNNEVYNTIWCNIGGVDVEVIVDSGTKRNIIDRLSWIELKAKNIQMSERTNEVDFQFRGYGGHKLNILGKFAAFIKVPNRESYAEFYVADEFGKILIGHDTAKALGILKIGYNANPNTSDVNVINLNKNIISNDSKVKQFGKIKGVLVDIPLKPDVKGVIQPYRRIPAPLEKRVDEKIEEMLQQGIIEKVDGVSKWVSGIVVAPKGSDDIRICVDMRRANLAVEVNTIHCRQWMTFYRIWMMQKFLQNWT
ncbi:uncharacterized protein LOC129910216 [Episyrphus balteatus]|uniref:uncharacterized protein LOC129910216 n=1 Tax=Episyrphus balteatus TaxID=286459 RepID=UPI0024850309|nr:uncharacterized protein LOC129910216 [Episyrphus balteatus]